MTIRPRDSNRRYTIIALLGCATLAGCSSAPPRRHVDLSKIHNAVPKELPRSTYGNPNSYVVNGKRYHVLASAKGYSAVGYASWYGRKFHGHRTSSGDIYNMYAMTAANKVLPLPSFVRVTNLENHHSVIVKINDRGPFHAGRIIDLSYVAAAKLGIIATGTARVKVVAIDAGAPGRKLATPPTKPAGLYLQAGAFSQEVDARKLLNRLTTAGLANAFITTPHGGRQFYRVRLGPYTNNTLRAQAARRIGALGIDPLNVEQ